MKIGIVGNAAIGTFITKILKDPEVVITNQENNVNPAFQPEPMYISAPPRMAFRDAVYFEENKSNYITGKKLPKLKNSRR